MIPRDPTEMEETLGLRPSSPAWRCATKAVFGRPMSAGEELLFLRLSGGRRAPAEGIDDLLIVAGRRGFKTGEGGRWGYFEGRHGNHEVALEPGQIGIVGVLAPLREQGAELVRYVHGIAALPSERRHVRRLTADGVEFTNNIAIKVITADDVAVAGGTWVMAIVDEAARLPGPEAAVPDRAILAALRPALAPIRGAPRRKFVMITSAYIQSGLAYETDRDQFGRVDAPTFVLRGSTETFNPNIDRAWLERERQKDPAVAMREYGDRDRPPEWQPAITDSWFGTSCIGASTDANRATSLPFEMGRRYVVAVDAGFTRDGYAIAVATSEQLPDPATFEKTPRRTIVVHVELFKPTPGRALSPRECIERTIVVMRRYQQSEVFLDQFCASVLVEAFADRRCRATKIEWTGSGANSKAARFRAVRAAMMDGGVRLPNDPALLKEFHNVRGHLTQTGHERIEALGVASDDRVSAVVMACSVAMALTPSRAHKDLTWWEQRQRDENDLKLAVAFGGGMSPF